jgi:hypothetical protein
VSDYRIGSFGAGAQSVAMLVLQATGRIAYDAYVFANVGDDSENPATLAYLRDYARPYANANGIELVEVRRTFNGEVRTLKQQLMSDLADIPIPARMANGAPGNRKCTKVWKVDAVNHWLRDQGVTRAHIGIGFSSDEMRRATPPEWTEVSKRPPLSTIREYPLIDLGLTREACRSLIASAGLPQPPKSACYFCPYTSRSQWTQMKQHAPDLFADAVAVEARLNEKRAAMGKDDLYIHPALQPLDRATPDQPSLMDIFFDDMDCASGYCGL